MAYLLEKNGHSKAVLMSDKLSKHEMLPSVSDYEFMTKVI